MLPREPGASRPPIEYYILRRDRLGFPSRCLEAQLRTQRRERSFPEELLVGALRAPPSRRPRRAFEPLLPLRPIWPGFALNTLFYAVILWLLIAGRFALRRSLRVKRGQCFACGYDLGHAEHAACPECGASPAIAARHRR